MKRLLIIGAGGHGAVVADAALESGNWTEIALLDDNPPGASVLNWPVVGGLEDLNKHLDADTEAVVAVGDNERRLNILDSIASNSGVLVSVVHPRACVSRSAAIRTGSVLCAGAIVNARASLGSGCIVNTGATVDHDCVIGDGVHISPGANLAGGVIVGDCAWIGIGAAIKEGTQIGRDAVVGAGAAVISDVADGEKVGGVPAQGL